jgi:GTP-binding protein
MKPAEPHGPIDGVLAIVGRPNVGKSTLFNRLVGGRPALVHDTPGVTRDRRYGVMEYDDRWLRVIDTGGLDPDARHEAIGAGIHRQAEIAMNEADAVIFVLDAMTGTTPIDRELAQRLHKLGRPVFVAANKVDHINREVLANELYELGLGQVFAISAAHGRGIDELMERVIALFPARPKPVEADPLVDLLDGDDDDDDAEPDEIDPAVARAKEPLRVALVGKPNAGKSSLLNRLVGSERSLVHDQPGTTTDPVDTPFSYGGREYVLIDTAGIRRKSRVEGDTEKLSVTLALGQIDRAHVVVLVVDAADGASEQDARLAGLIEASGRAVVIALNKADLLAGAGAGRETLKEASDEFHFLTWAPRQLVSALRGDGLAELFGKIEKAAFEHGRRVATGELNRFFAEVCDQYPPTTRAGKLVTVHYLTQGGTRPPTFLLWANRADLVDDSYRRFVVNQLRARYGFGGTPIRVIIKQKAKKDGGSGGGKKRKR